MEDISVEIGGRKIPLRFKMPQFAEIEEEVGNLLDPKELIIEGKKRVRNIMTMIRIMGNAGLKKAGEEPDLTDEWLGENMEPMKILTYQIALMAVMAREGESEAEKENSENTKRDLVLEEINKKKEPMSSPTGESSTGD